MVSEYDEKYSGRIKTLIEFDTDDSWYCSTKDKIAVSVVKPAEIGASIVCEQTMLWFIFGIVQWHPL